MNLGIPNPMDMVKDQLKRAALDLAMDALQEGKSDLEFIEEVVKPMGIEVVEKGKRSMENLKALVIKKAIETKQVWKLLKEAMGFNKDSLLYSMVVGQPKMKSFKALSDSMPEGRKKNGNVFFPSCGINDMESLFNAPKHALNSMREIQENFAFSLDSPLVLPGTNSAAVAIQRLHTTLADLAGKLLPGESYPQILKFDAIGKDGKMPAKIPGSPMQFVIMPDVPYVNGVPDEAFLEKLIAFRNQGENKGRTFLETSEYLAYVDVYETPYEDPEAIFQKYGIVPDAKMRQTVIDIHNFKHTS